jgi:rubredoxin
MKQHVRCKACGYVMEAGRVRDRCPACGVPAKQFEPYDEKISDKRRRILDLHMHPIVVHLPQAFAAFLIPLAVALMMAVGDFRSIVIDTTRVLSVVLPFSVMLAFAAGLLDGKIRFRRVTTPVLVRKMVLASLLLASSFGAAALAVFSGLDTGGPLAAFVSLCLLDFFAAVGLGFLGFPLIVAKFPG